MFESVFCAPLNGLIDVKILIEQSFSAHLIVEDSLRYGKPQRDDET